MKRLIQQLLKTPLFTYNPFYRWAYWRNVHKLVPKLSDKPRRIIVENTNHCNLQCDYCGNPHMKRRKGIMSNELFFSIVDQAKEMEAERIFCFGIGEPLLDRDYDIKVSYAKGKGIKDVRCITNGVLLDHLPNVDYLGVSVNSKDVIPNLKRVWEQRKGKVPFIEARLKPDTACFAKEIKPYCDKVNMYINLTNWGDVVRGNVPRGVRFPCSDLWTTLFITWDGKVGLCCKDYECEEQIGDLKKQSLKAIWNSPELAAWRYLHLKNVYQGICGNCLSNIHLVNPWWRVKW